MAASSVLGYIGQARVPLGLVTIYWGTACHLLRATETDALIVCINGVVLAMNLMLLPLTLQVASSGTSIFLTMRPEFELFFFARVNIAIGYYEPPWFLTSDNDLFDGSRFSESC